MKTTPKRSYVMQARATTVAGTRQRIAEEMLRLALEHDLEDITLTMIARTAGVSHQTVLNHFQSKDGVVLAAAELLQRQVAKARNGVPPGDTRGAVAVLVADYERIGDANARWAMAGNRLGRVALLLDEARAGHQQWLRQVFDDRLPAGRISRRRTVNALHAATDVYVWKLLRRDLGLGLTETRRIIEMLVRGVLGADPQSRAGTGR